MSEWKEYKLESIISEKIDNRGRNPESYQEKGIPVIDNFMITGNKHMNLQETKRFIDEEIYINFIRNYTIEGDVLITLVGNGYGNVSTAPKQKNVIIQNTVGLRTNEKSNNNFLFYYLSFTKPSIKDLDRGAAQPSIKVGDLLSLDILLPPLPEQKAIAGVLSSLDDKIDLLHRQNKTLEAMAETLFRQWFVEEASDEWEEACLGDEFDFTMGQSPPGTSYNEENNGMPMYQGNADFSFRFPNERIYTTEPKRLAQAFDTLISVRAPVGAQNMAEKECCIGRGVAAFRYKKNIDYYTYTYFKLRSLMKEIKQFNDEGTVFGSIGKTDFHQMQVTIPKENIIKEFEQEVRPLNDKIIKNCYQIRTLESLRDTLLPKLMSGEVRVRF